MNDNEVVGWPHVWMPPTELPDGHRLFEASTAFRTTNGRPLIAIADDSGERPEQTDDGVLWLDFDRALMLPSPDHMPKIPVLTPDSEPRWVSTDAVTIMCLAWRKEWNVNVHGILLKVTAA